MKKMEYLMNGKVFHAADDEITDEFKAEDAKEDNNADHSLTANIGIEITPREREMNNESKVKVSLNRGPAQFPGDSPQETSGLSSLKVSLNKHLREMTTTGTSTSAVTRLTLAQKLAHSNGVLSSIKVNNSAKNEDSLPVIRPATNVPEEKKEVDQSQWLNPWDKRSEELLKELSLLRPLAKEDRDARVKRFLADLPIIRPATNV